MLRQKKSMRGSLKSRLSPITIEGGHKLFFSKLCLDNGGALQRTLFCSCMLKRIDYLEVANSLGIFIVNLKLTVFNRRSAGQTQTLLHPSYSQQLPVCSSGSKAVFPSRISSIRTGGRGHPPRSAPDSSGSSPIVQHLTYYSNRLHSKSRCSSLRSRQLFLDDHSDSLRYFSLFSWIWGPILLQGGDNSSSSSAIF